MVEKYKRPTYRECNTVAFRVGSHNIELSMSHRPKDDPDAPGAVFEVFYNNYKEGGPFGSIQQVLCASISRSLQHGDTPEDMLDGTMGRLPFPPSGRVFQLDNDKEVYVGNVVSIPNLILRTIIWANQGYGELSFDAD